MGFTPNHQDVRMPEEEFGRCQRRDCNKIEWLADGLCVEHWDRTTDKERNTEVDKC